MRHNRVAVRWDNWERAGGQVAIGGGQPASITFPDTPLVGRIEIALGADPSGDPADWLWLDITQWVRYSPEISITKGRPDEASTVDAGKANLSLDNRDGRFCRRNPLSPYYGQLSKNTPIRIGVNAGTVVLYRFHGFVNEWPTRWDRSGNDTIVPIVCSGVLRRLGTGAIRSTLYRAGTTGTDVNLAAAYWPMEDGENATSFASGLPGGTPMTFSGSVTPAQYSGLAGSAPMPTFGSGGTASARIPRTVDTTGNVNVIMHLNMPDSMVNDSVFFTLYTTGTVKRWTVTYASGGNGSLRLQGYDASNVEVYNSGTIVPGELNLGPVELQVNLVQDGADIDVTLFWYPGGLYAYGTLGTVSSQTVGFASSLSFQSLNTGSVGHVAVSASANYLNTSYANNFAFGYPGEAAHTRMIRLCAEEGVPMHCTSARSIAMGPQPRATLLSILRDAEAADGGVLYEHEFGFGYQSVDDRVNAPVALALDFDAGDIAEPPEPADDDQKLTNRAVVTRTGGSTATVEDAESIARDGLYETSATVNVETDADAAGVAGWKVHLGTVDEDRWPSIAMRFNNTPDLIPTWSAMPFGSRITATNPPDQTAPDDLDLIIEGWTERITEHTWDVSLNTVPASVYQTGVYAASATDPNPLAGVWQADTLTLAASVTSGATSWTVRSDPAFTTNTGHFPQDARIGGEQVTVGSCVSVLTDAFGRSVSNGIGTADTGQVYTIAGGAAADFSVSSGAAHHSIASVNVERQSYVDVGSADCRLAINFQFGVATTTGGPIYYSLAGRLTDSNNFYFASMRLDDATGNVFLALEARVASGGSILVPGVVVGANAGAADVWHLELSCIGTQLVASAYRVANPSNVAWVSATDTSLTTGTKAGFITYASSTNTNPLPITSVWDNFEDSYRQTWTVTRAVNGVTKAHDITNPAETDITLVDGLIWAPY